MNYPQRTIFMNNELPTLFDICRIFFTNQPFIMQNEPNFLNDQMNVNKVLTKDYEKKCNWTLGKNEPKRTQFQCSIMLNCAICSANTSTGPVKFRESADTLSYYDRENTLAKYCEMAMIMPNVAYTTFRPKGNSNSRSKCAYEFETIKFGGKPL